MEGGSSRARREGEFSMSVERTVPKHQDAFLKRVVRPRLVNMTPEAATAILQLRLDDRDRDRMRELLNKNNQGILSAEEESELESYVTIGKFLDLMRAKAFGSLKKAGMAPPTPIDE
jgi:hypothetical protein